MNQRFRKNQTWMLVVALATILGLVLAACQPAAPAAPAAESGAGAQPLEAPFEAVLEGVGHGPELDRPGRVQGLGRRARAAATAADQGHFQLVAARRMGAPGNAQPGHRR